jgi:hypothetical protein
MGIVDDLRRAEEGERAAVFRPVGIGQCRRSAAHGLVGGGDHIMSHVYRPRRAGARWREDAPAYVLDCFDYPAFTDRYTVLLGERFLVAGNGPGETTVPYLAMSGAPTHPQGISLWGEMSAAQAAAYRYRNGHRRARWLDLPEVVRRHVVARCEED